MIKITRKKVVRFLRVVSGTDPRRLRLLIKDSNSINELGVSGRGINRRQKSLSWTGAEADDHMRRTLSTAVETAKIFMLLLLESAGETKNPGRPGA